MSHAPWSRACLTRWAVSLATLAACLAAEPAAAQSPDWMTILTVRPNPSPYLADWQSDPTLVTLVLSYTGSADVAFYLIGSIKRVGTTVASGRSTPFEFVRPSQLLLSTRDGIWESGSVTYEAALRTQLERTGRIPEGDYQFCVEVHAGLPESGGGAQLSRACEPFAIVAPAPPSLIMPGDRDSVSLDYPVFAWTPVIVSPNERVSYHLRLTEVFPGQSPIEAVNNVPQFEGDVSSTSLAYPRDALPLRDSTRYAWQVQALDGFGSPVGERQGKSEIFTFTWHPAARAFGPPVVAGADSLADTTSTERAVATFQWGPLQVKVLSLTDSSFENYSGRGRVTIVAGVFEPLFKFRSVHLTPDGKKVRWAPRHVVTMPNLGTVFDKILGQVPAPFWVNLQGLVLVADSATGEQHAGLSGDGVVVLGWGTADSLRTQPRADSMTIISKWNCTDPNAMVAGYPISTGTYCTPAEETKIETQAGVSNTDALVAAFKEVRSRALYFAFDDLRVTSKGPAGTISLASDYSSDIAGLPDAKISLVADSTKLVMGDGAGTLTLDGAFTLPPTAGLIRDKPDTTFETKNGQKKVTGIDSLVTLTFTKAILGTSGELYIAAKGIPRSHIGKTGLHLTTGNAWIDFSSSSSPPGKAGSWQGVLFDSARVELPQDWQVKNGQPTAAIVGYKMSVDAGGFSGNVFATQLDKLGPVGFGGFDGQLDSLHFRFTEGTLDTGYVEGQLKLPFMQGNIDYAVNFTPEGIGQAWAKLTKQEPISVPALHAKVVIQRGRFDYANQVGTFTMDARLTLDQDGILLKDAQVYGLSISSDGRMALKGAWLGFDAASNADFRHFPVALDSIGVGAGTGDGEVWLGLAGRFQLNENLPSGAGVFRVFAARGSDGGWTFEKLSVDKLDLAFQNAVVAFKGSLLYIQNDPVYGNAFKASVQMAVQNQFVVSGNFIVGATEPAAAGGGGAGSPAAAGGASGIDDPEIDRPENDTHGPGAGSAAAMGRSAGEPIAGDLPSGGTALAACAAQPATASFRYWYVDAKLILPPPGIQLGILPLAIYGFGGGAYARMCALVDTVTLAVKYVPDATTAFGLKALLTLGSSASAGYVWNGDVTLEAAVSTSGGLSALTLRGDNWMLTTVQQREKRLWGTVNISLPVSQPVLQANIVLNVNIPPALKGTGWAELHFTPTDWYVHVGTPNRPDSLKLMPGVLNLNSTAYFMMDKVGVDAGFATYLKQEKKVGDFYGRVDAGFEAEATMRYRPFFARGDGELWGNLVAKYKSYTLLDGTARATMNFTLPDPTRIWGKVTLKYSLLAGTIHGTYRMRYSWGSGGEADSGGTAGTFTMVAATYPVSGDTLGPPNGVSYYFGMNEGTDYGADDGNTYRLRLTGTPALASGKLVAVKTPIRVVAGRTVPATSTTTMQWTSLGTPVVNFDEERVTMTVKPPSYGVLASATQYRSIALFALEKRNGDGTWSAVRTEADTVVFRTAPGDPTLGQFVGEVDPAGGASPLYYGGPNQGRVRVRFTNLPTQLTSGAITAQLRAGGGGDSVAGSWGRMQYALSKIYGTQTDPTLYGFLPTAAALAPATKYRFSLVTNDSTRAELYGVSFATSRYPSLQGHLAASALAVAPRRGIGPLTATGSYLLGLTVTLTSGEALVWDDLEQITVEGVTAEATVTPATRCVPPPSTTTVATGSVLSDFGLISSRSRLAMCGATPAFANTIEIGFTAATDAGLPASSTPSITLVFNHRREGQQRYVVAVPPPPAVKTAPVRTRP